MLEAGIEELEALGFRVRRRDDIADRHLYLAGPDGRRVEEVRELFLDPEVRAVFCARGGYGWPRILSHLDWEELGRDPKPLVGFSDATPALGLMVDRAGVVSVHGPMVAWDLRQGEQGYDREMLLRLLMRDEPIGVLSPPGLKVLRPGEAEGPLAGGCLSLVAATLGTPYAPDLDGRILFLEDWASKPFQIDRMLHHLRHAGALDGVRGIVFGEMLDCRQTEADDYSVEEVVLDCLDGSGFPVLYGFPSGHVSGPNLPLPLGVPARLLATGAPAVEILEPAVS
jgi:muramoyltetrapeptide carboxypeptidase